MTTAELTASSTSELLEMDREIGQDLDRLKFVDYTSTARELLSARKAVRAELERRHAASGN